MASVELIEVGKTYPNGFEAVRAFSMDIAAGESVAIMGSSGSGVLGGSGGAVAVDGQRDGLGVIADLLKLHQAALELGDCQQATIAGAAAATAGRLALVAGLLQQRLSLGKDIGRVGLANDHHIAVCAAAS